MGSKIAMSALPRCPKCESLEVILSDGNIFCTVCGYDSTEGDFEE